ncbi:uncharacterized protein K02A2.6-like [Ostrea edulis]|uniref:uncharacterized protein K02A2.6-like n=1 Tax=Ostrea edulis TaxID=37623 RepID=UPI0024AEC2D3|nr:uncharacterized protein K02A2.6-like [Ostrea edulis]
MGEAEPTPVQVYSCPFRLPPQLELTIENVSENFKKWKRQVEVYLAASGGTDKAKEVQELLLREDKLTLERTIQVCRAYEQSNRQVKELRETTLKVNKIQKSNDKHTKWKKIHSVSQEEEFDEDQWLKAVSAGGKEVTAIMQVNDCDIRFQLDSAADVSTISQRHVRKEQCKPTKVRLNMWNKTNMKPFGEADLTVINPRTNKKHQLRFIVVPNQYTCLLGHETVQKLKLITINDERFIASVSSSDLGDLGTAHLHVDPNVRPKALPCRKIPITLQSLVREELQKLEDRGVLIPITEPTPWVSQMAIGKANGKLRLCIDPQALNIALIREHYRLPVLDDILPQLSKARIFTKLDVKEAFWHVKLNEESSRLTTMITPFGRYRWARLPFGLKVSNEIHQRKLDEAFGDMTGVFSVVDDIIIAGCGANDTEAK